MSQPGDDRVNRVLRGALAGLVAGATASFVMDRFQAAVSGLLPPSDDDGERREPATEKAADGVARALTGGELPPVGKPLGGQAMHYAVGIGLGVAYGVAAEFRPGVTAGFGTAFGAGTATVLDEAAVPALGLGTVPWETGPAIHLYSYVSHLVFGGVAELVRRQVVGTLEA